MPAITILSAIVAVPVIISIIVFGAQYLFFFSPFSMSDFKDTEKIDSIHLTANDRESNGDLDTNVYVTLFNADHDAKKMPDRDTISLNGVIMIPVFHKSNGVTSSRYVYEVTTRKSQILTFSIKRANGEEITKSIKSFNFKADLPTQISRSKIFSLPYTSSVTTKEALRYFVSIDSLSRSSHTDPRLSLMDNNTDTWGIHFSPKSVDGKKMISENEIDNEKIAHLKIGKVVLDVAAVYRQDQDLVNGDYKFHGSYSIGYKKVIEIIQ